MRFIRKVLCLAFALLMITCSKSPYYTDDYDDEDGNVHVHFTLPSDAVVDKFNIQLFDNTGAKVFEKVKTQEASDSRFGRLSLNLDEGDYIVVAVAHSSVRSATIASPQDVRFTANAGEKLTDTFSYCGAVSVSGGSPVGTECEMQRVTALVRLILTDEEIPDNFARLLIEYTGGSANFNPSTLQGITKSKQSESRPRTDSNIYEVYTFPYLADAGVLKITLTPLASDGSAIRNPLTIENVPIARNNITTLTGNLFTDCAINQDHSSFTFTVDDWDGTINYRF